MDAAAGRGLVARGPAGGVMIWVRREGEQPVAIGARFGAKASEGGVQEEEDK